MPSKNTVKIYAEDAYYHLYNRGVDKCDIFKDDEDYRVMLNLLKRYLDKQQHSDKYGRPYKNYAHELKLLSYCLMPNHFHLLVYQKEKRGITHLMRSVMTSYTAYFNNKYDRVGSLFQGVYKASIILNQTYLWHISRYIHLNPVGIGEDYLDYQYSSIDYFKEEKTADWIHSKIILSMHEQHGQSYLNFLKDYRLSSQQDYKSGFVTY